MKKAIVTGANGFIGSNVIEELINNSIEVIAIDIRFDKLPDNPLITKIRADLNSIDELNISGDVFFHFAWTSVAGDGRANPETQIYNLQLTLNCLELAKKSNCLRFIYASSIIEDEASIACKTPNIKPGVGYIYGSVKQMVGSVAQMTAAKLGLDFVSGKITNTYGETEPTPRLINTTLRRIIANEPLKFTEGNQYYDFIHISDAVRAFRIIAERGKPFSEYLVGSGKAKALREWLLDVKKAVAPDYDFPFGEVPFSGVSLPLEYYDIAGLRNN